MTGLRIDLTNEVEERVYRLFTIAASTGDERSTEEFAIDGEGGADCSAYH